MGWGVLGVWRMYCELNCNNESGTVHAQMVRTIDNTMSLACRTYEDFRSRQEHSVVTAWSIYTCMYVYIYIYAYQHGCEDPTVMFRYVRAMFCFHPEVTLCGKQEVKNPVTKFCWCICTSSHTRHSLLSGQNNLDAWNVCLQDKCLFGVCEIVEERRDFPLKSVLSH